MLTEGSMLQYLLIICIVLLTFCSLALTCAGVSLAYRFILKQSSPDNHLPTYYDEVKEKAKSYLPAEDNPWESARIDSEEYPKISPTIEPEREV